MQLKSLFTILFIFGSALALTSSAQFGSSYPPASTTPEPFADQNGPSATAPPSLPQDPVDVPIDGGVSVIIGAGVLYGLKKVRDQRKKQQAKN